MYIGYFPIKDMQTPPLPLSFAPVLMKDAQCAESNEKNQFSEYYFTSCRENSLKIGSFEYKNSHNSENKNQKTDFSFVSVHSASFM